MSAVVLLMYAEGMPLFCGGRTVPMSILTAVSFSLLSLGLLLAAGPDTLPLSMFKTATGGNSRSPSRWIGRTVTAAFMFLLAAVGTVGYYYFTHQVATWRNSGQSELSAIAQLKIQGILDWRAERLGEAKAIMHEPFVGQEVQKFLAGPAGSPLRGPLLAWLSSIRESNQGLRALLLDPQLNVRLAFPEDRSYLGPIAKVYAAEAVRSFQVVFSDLHHSQYSGEIHMDLAIPLAASCGLPIGGLKADIAQGQPVAVVLIEVDPYRSLVCQYPGLAGAESHGGNAADPAGRRRRRVSE